jgi:hypothetical protein
MPGKLNLNHPLNYLVVAWVCAQESGARLMEGMEGMWGDLRKEGSRGLAIHGARYLGLIDLNDQLTSLGRIVTDLMAALDFSTACEFNKRARFCETSPGLAAITRFVLLQQEGTKLIIEALRSMENTQLNTEELLRAAERINAPLATGLFLLDPRSASELSIPSSVFSPSNVSSFKQVLWHSGILSTKKHPSAGRSSEEYRHKEDFWKLESQVAESVSFFL